MELGDSLQPLRECQKSRTMIVGLCCASNFERKENNGFG